MNPELEIHVDGACSGNPGPAGVGVVVRRDGKIIKEISRAIGDATNNIAEYSALICALQEALVLKAKTIRVFTDSELIHNQVKGLYKVKNPKMKTLFDQVQHLRQGFESFELIHVLRAKNADADRLATRSLQKREISGIAPMFDNVGEESPSSKG